MSIKFLWIPDSPYKWDIIDGRIVINLFYFKTFEEIHEVLSCMQQLREAKSI